MLKKNPYIDPLLDPNLACPEKELSPVVSPEPGEGPLPDISDEELIEACKARLGYDPEGVKKAEDEKLRALADLDNARKRLVREKEEFMAYSAEKILSDILPALDNLDLALAYAPKDKDTESFVVGVEMTRKLLLDSLERHGLTLVGELGEPFDPQLHEAVGMESRPGFVDGTVCEMMTRGYRLRDRLLRPARVVVCKLQ